MLRQRRVLLGNLEEALAQEALPETAQRQPPPLLASRRLPRRPNYDGNFRRSELLVDHHRLEAVPESSST
eukprot:6801515-Prorocentrum_lima.AAC.1